MEQYEPIIRLVKNPQELRNTDLAVLEQCSKEFPYLQAVRALIAKLSGSPSHIKNVSAYTANRKVLRDFLRKPFDTNINMPPVSDMQIQTEMVNAFEKLSDNTALAESRGAEETTDTTFVAPPQAEETLKTTVETTSTTTSSQNIADTGDMPSYQLPESYESATSSYDDSLRELMKNIEESKKMLDKIREKSLRDLESKQVSHQEKPVTAVSTPAPSDGDNPLDFSFFDITAFTEAKQKND